MAEAFLHYDRVADCYDQPRHRSFYGHLAERLCIFSTNYVQPESVLDIGCGTGISTIEIIRHFPHAEVTAADRSLSMLAVAQKKEDTKIVSFCHGGIKDIAHLNKTFDLIVANMSLHWLPFEDRLALRDVLKENGILAVSFPLIAPFRKREGNRLLLSIFRRLRKTDPAWRPFHDMRGLSWKEIETLPGFSPIHLEPYYMEERFGTGSEFVEVLKVRGVFFSLFGNRAALAEEYALEMLPENTSISYCWPAGIAVVRQDAGLENRDEKACQRAKAIPSLTG